MKLESLMRLLDQGYSPAGAVADYGWDFASNTVKPAGSGDDLARFVCVEAQETYDPSASSLGQIQQLHANLTKSAEDLTRTAEAVHVALVKFIAVEFWTWFRNSGRKNYVVGLLQSWCDVHPEQIVRDLQPVLILYVSKCIPDRPLSDEVMAEVDMKLCGELLVRPTAPPPPPPVPATT